MVIRRGSLLWPHCRARVSRHFLWDDNPQSWHSYPETRDWLWKKHLSKYIKRFDDILHFIILPKWFVPINHTLKINVTVAFPALWWCFELSEFVSYRSSWKYLSLIQRWRARFDVFTTRFLLRYWSCWWLIIFGSEHFIFIDGVLASIYWRTWSVRRVVKAFNIL